MHRSTTITLPGAMEASFQQYKAYLDSQEDFSPNSKRGYLADIRLFFIWAHQSWDEGQSQTESFSPAMITTPLITSYRSYVQTVLGLKPASINRALVSIKRYTAWATEQGVIIRDVAVKVKQVPKDTKAPRNLTSQEENQLMGAVEKGGNIRDRTIITMLLHSGLRAEELCSLKRRDIHLQTKSGWLAIYGKRNKYREVRLNSTARDVITEYLATIPIDATFIFPGKKQGSYLTTRMLRYIVSHYAHLAKVADLHPHDLRHRYAYRLKESGVPMEVIARLLGHEQLETTMLYGKATEDDVQRHVEKIAWK